MTLDWTHIVSGLVGAFVIFLLGVAKDYWMRRAQRKSAARYLAIRVTCILDDFIESCMEAVGDDGLCQGQTAADGSREPQVGEIYCIEYPTGLDWTSIDHALMYQLLSLPSRLKAANGTIEGTWQFSYPPDYEEFFEERCLKYSELGLIALGFTQELRRRYNLPENVASYWDPEVRLREAREKVEAERCRQRELQEYLHAKRGAEAAT